MSLDGGDVGILLAAVSPRSNDCSEAQYNVWDWALKLVFQSGRSACRP